MTQPVEQKPHRRGFIPLVARWQHDQRRLKIAPGIFHLILLLASVAPSMQTHPVPRGDLARDGEASYREGCGWFSCLREYVYFADDKSTVNPTPKSSNSDFGYHKKLLPLTWYPDGLTLVLASLGLVIAAGGGIGGGGILVPVYMLVLAFRPKHAIALSNITILGGAIANTMINVQKKHPVLNQGLIDWDLIIVMEPLTIFGAVFGTLLSKVLPNIVLTSVLALILAFMADRTLRKGIKMYKGESARALLGLAGRNNLTRGSDAVELESKDPPPDEEAAVPAGRVVLHPPVSGRVSPAGSEDVSFSFLRDAFPQTPSPGSTNAPANSMQGTENLGWKILLLSSCFVLVFLITLLRGGGHYRSPLGVDCGSFGYWTLFFITCPVVLVYALYFRKILVAEHDRKLAIGHSFAEGEVHWDSWNTIKYPLVCGISGLLAGMFGVGGGIIKGPLMLEMGIIPSVASSTAATMILYTAASASGSFAVFGLLEVEYAVMLFCLGLVCTTVGQVGLTRLSAKADRQSPIVLSIGAVIALSAVLIGIESVTDAVRAEASWGELLEMHEVCGGQS